MPTLYETIINETHILNRLNLSIFTGLGIEFTNWDESKNTFQRALTSTWLFFIHLTNHTLSLESIVNNRIQSFSIENDAKYSKMYYPNMLWDLVSSK